MLGSRYVEVFRCSRAEMEHLRSAQGHGHVWLVGAYSRYTMPLLENGVASAMAVASKRGPPPAPRHRTYSGVGGT